MLTHITRLSVHALTLPHPVPFPQRVLSPDPSLARPKMLFVKINFQIRLESVYLARRRGIKIAREGTASGGREGSCSLSGGFWGGEWATAALQQDRAAEPGLLPGLSQPLYHEVPRSCLVGQAKVFLRSAPSP